MSNSDPGPWYDDIAIPALLRAARRAYGQAIQHALTAAGCDDMPRNGSFVLASIARNGSQLGDVITTLGLSKQRAGQLVDALVARGYLERSPDPDDRRRMNVMLTDRGTGAAATIRRTVDAVDAQLESRVGAESIGHARAALGALVEMTG